MSYVVKVPCEANLDTVKVIIKPERQALVCAGDGAGTFADFFL